MVGFYLSHGDSGKMAVTQFEATEARRAFPCWDEPNLKATFSIKLTVSKEVDALSNMHQIAEEPAGDALKTVTFAITPKMSTYLVAFAVGKFEYIEEKTSGQYNKQPITVRVYTLPGLISQGKFALQCAVYMLEYFAKIFDIPYPLPKLDMIAVPDFDAGAMENWGLVTYRNVCLLFDENESSIATKIDVAYTVGHELAHQWFGNLVTMDWWEELWLNEGFATWVGWLSVDAFFPQWDIWAWYVLCS